MVKDGPTDLVRAKNVRTVSAARKLLMVLQVDSFLHFFADLEIRKPFFFDLNYLSGFWIASLVAVVTFDLEATEAPDFDTVRFGKRFRH